MPEITIISGKGGTGKTSLTGAFAHINREFPDSSQVICDLDVDAPDLHLLLDPVKVEVQNFFAGHTASIDISRCTECGECLERCRFDAVSHTEEGMVINPVSCEGCKVCVEFCPADAIEWRKRLCGEWFVSDTRFGPMVHAQLFPGQENSGLLVSLLRQRARQMAESQEISLILSDGSPGIGCPVISSLTGTDLAVIVTEPTPSGLHDLERVADLCAHFRVPVMSVINKWELNPDMSASIERTCKEKNIEIVGKLPYEPDFVRAMVQRQVISEYTDGAVTHDIRAAWKRIKERAAVEKAAR